MEVNISEDELNDTEAGESEQSKARAKLRKLMNEQGVKPITAEQLDAMGDLWPEDETVVDFIAVVREWRRDGSARRVP